MSIELPHLTLQEKWETAEGNLIYFIVCGISYAKAHGQTAEDFGTWAGQVATRSWEEQKSDGPCGLVEAISYNKQQFHDFQMEILDESEVEICARMKSFGEDTVYKEPGLRIIGVDDYIRFFDKKWVAIADFLGLKYEQHVEGDWVVFTVCKQ